MAEDGDENEVKLVVDTHIDFPDSDRFASITVRFIPQSEAYPEGVKYSMHYGDYDDTTILRYDNAHEDTKGHERHTSEDTEEIEFPGWRDLLNRFRQEVMDHEREHDN